LIRHFEIRKNKQPGRTIDAATSKPAFQVLAVLAAMENRTNQPHGEFPATNAQRDNSIAKMAGGSQTFPILGD